MSLDPNVKKTISTLKIPQQEFLEEDEMLKASVEMYKSLMEE